jgi:hypothetical protein
MTKKILTRLFACGVVLIASTATGAPTGFSFGVLAHPVAETSTDVMLSETIAETDADNLAFVVTTGIKSAAEPCTDQMYNRRKSLLDKAQNGLIVSLASSDWTECLDQKGKSAAAARLNRMRELFFSEEFSMGASRIPLVRQSASAKYRSYGENARWEIGDIMFVTVNLPANNNHYLSDAGRNGEFEDRLIANRDWLRRAFTYAALKKMDGLVVFCDGNPLARSVPPGGKRDGFAEVRRHILTLVEKFPGKVLIVHRGTESPSTGIAWRGNVGGLPIGPSWVKVDVDTTSPTLFDIREKK